MQPRDVFDVVLLVVLGVALTLDQYDVCGALSTPGAAVEAAPSLDVAVYLVIAGIFGVAFVGYIAVYLPYKQSETTTR